MLNIRGVKICKVGSRFFWEETNSRQPPSRAILLILMNAVTGPKRVLLMYSGKRAYWVEWGHDTADQQPLNLLVPQVQRQHAMAALQFWGTSKWRIILFRGQHRAQKGGRLGDDQSHIGRSRPQGKDHTCDSINILPRYSTHIGPQFILLIYFSPLLASLGSKNTHQKRPT